MSNEYEIDDPSFVRVTAASHPTTIGDPIANAHSALDAIKQYAGSEIIVFGELSLTGYSCGDLFAQDLLLEKSIDALELLASQTHDQVVVVGLPLRVENKLYNCAVLIAQGQVQGIVPKQFLPNYQEFYEARWFCAANGSEAKSVSIAGMGEIPFGIDVLFDLDELVLGIELCEDLWMPIPPSSLQAAAGANLILNLSASNELIGKADWRKTLIRSQSGRCLAAYAYASAGPSESSTDVVFGGHCLLVENGAVLAESERIGQSGCTWLEHSQATADVDLQKLTHDRQLSNSWQIASQRCNAMNPIPYRRISIVRRQVSDGSQRQVNARPFVPKEGPALHARCAEIFGIQCASLTQRLRKLPADMKLNIGISGGLDSTLALLVAAKTCQSQGWPSSRIHAITMPGFGTTDKTLASARDLMQHLEVESEEIDIREMCFDTFRALQHKPFGMGIDGLDLDAFVDRLGELPPDKLNDLVFENVQARTRTLILMSRGFVLGTGDLSEQALGWSTYNGDHMSMYNVNTSIPKTLVRFLVRYLAKEEFQGPASQCLLDIADTPISPELLPPSSEGEIQQETEASIGSYELHDFFLYHMIRFGCGPKRILQLASLAEFSQPFAEEEIRQTLTIFLKRFFGNQFKRSCVPDGPKVGSVSLSPRGDWRMPSDADSAAWIAALEDAEKSL
ncbi:MAG: NAD(+) synthase [Planctomycetota bacterium]